MARPPRDPLSDRPGTYFITANAAGKRNLFQSERMGDLFLDIIQRYRSQKKYLLHEYTLMPNHFHALLTTKEGTILTKAAQFIKGGYSFEAGKLLGHKAEIWQAGFGDHRIQDANDYANHKNYIWQNAVKRGLVELPEEHRYCSAFPGTLLDPPPDYLRG
jgi:putative transposase